MLFSEHLTEVKVPGQLRHGPMGRNVIAPGPKRHINRENRGKPHDPAQRGKDDVMAVVTMRQLLESGVHFGHQTRRWNPKKNRCVL